MIMSRCASATAHMAGSEHAEQIVALPLAPLQRGDRVGGKGAVGVVAGVEIREAQPAPVVVAIGGDQIVPCGNGDVFVAADRRIHVTVMGDMVAALLEQRTEPDDLLGEGAGVVFGRRNRVRDAEDVEAVAFPPCCRRPRFPSGILAVALKDASRLIGRTRS